MQERREGATVGRVGQRRVPQRGESGCEIDVAGDRLGVAAGRDARAAYEQRKVDVRLVRGLLACGHAVLAEMEPVVGGENDVRAIDDAGALQLLDECLDEIID